MPYSPLWRGAAWGCGSRCGPLFCYPDSLPPNGCHPPLLLGIPPPHQAFVLSRPFSGTETVLGLNGYYFPLSPPLIFLSLTNPCLFPLDTPPPVTWLKKNLCRTQSSFLFLLMCCFFLDSDVLFCPSSFAFCAPPPHDFLCHVPPPLLIIFFSAMSLLSPSFLPRSLLTPRTQVFFFSHCPPPPLFSNLGFSPLFWLVDYP